MHSNIFFLSSFSFPLLPLNLWCLCVNGEDSCIKEYVLTSFFFFCFSNYSVVSFFLPFIFAIDSQLWHILGKKELVSITSQTTLNISADLLGASYWPLYNFQVPRCWDSSVLNTGKMRDLFSTKRPKGLAELSTTVLAFAVAVFLFLAV